jgi:hypothetical protein
MSNNEIQGIKLSLVSDEEIKKKIEGNKYCMEKYGMSQMDYALSKVPHGKLIKMCLDDLQETCSKPLLLIDETKINKNKKTAKEKLADIVDSAKILKLNDEMSKMTINNN